MRPESPVRSLGTGLGGGPGGLEASDEAGHGILEGSAVAVRIVARGHGHGAHEGEGGEEKGGDDVGHGLCLLCYFQYGPGVIGRKGSGVDF